MSVVAYLKQIRPAWLEKTSYRLARGEGVRERFTDQLNTFYNLLLESVEQGDPAGLEGLMEEWVQAEPSPEDGENLSLHLLKILTEILEQTQAVSADLLPPEAVNQVMQAILPIFGSAYEKLASLEVGVHVAKIRTDLLEVQSKLERLDRTKSNFIAVAAHELKTPLTLLEGYTMMMKDLFPVDDQGSAPILLLKGMDNGTRRLKEIIEDMIDVSLIDNDLLNLNFQPFWLNRLFEILHADLSSALAERSQILEMLAFDGSTEVNFGDSERLYQAFRNLLVNAIKFTPDFGQISISGRKLPGFVEVTITDTGIGIDLQDQSTIFEKFGRLGDVQRHSSGKTKYKGGGPGLGLPIARGIIEAHGGTIWVESEGFDEDKHPGSTFHVLLPLRFGPPDGRNSLFFEVLKDHPSTIASEPAK